ncbi:MAG: hypothetical protein RL173_3155 [Fibrobacterota bacterium]
MSAAIRSKAWVPDWIRPLTRTPVRSGRTLFLSDLHMGTDFDKFQRLGSLLELLASVPGNIDDLVFGGDTFEFWWEWSHAVPHGHWEFLHAVRKLSDSGVRTKFVAGNHDFAIGPKLAEICGAQVHPDGFCLEIGTRRWLAIHGDAVPPSERGDRVVRKILRSPVIQRLWNLIHPDIALRLALAVGAGSRYVEPGPAASTIEMEPTMRAWMTEFDLAGVVHGHSHRPMLTNGPEGTYINNGDWVRMRTAVWIDPSMPARLVDCSQEGFPWRSNT